MPRWIAAALVFVVLVAAARPAAADPADSLYRAAFTALAEGQRERARELLTQLVAEHPEDPLAARAQLLLVRLTVRRSSGLARGEFLLFQTLHGVGVGSEVCVLLDCEGARPVAAALILGAGAGFGLAFLVSRDGIEPAHALLLDTATVWGFWNAAALTLTVDRTWSDEALAGTFLAGQAVGLLGGELAWRLLRPTAGEVSTASSVGFWSGVIALWINGLVADSFEDGVSWATVWVASDAGLVAGIPLGRALQISRGRSLLIDTGGVVGALAGMGLGAISDDQDAFFGLALAGTVAGLVVATWATRHWDVKDPPRLTPVISPTPGGAMLGFGGRF